LGVRCLDEATFLPGVLVLGLRMTRIWTHFQGLGPRNDLFWTPFWSPFGAIHHPGHPRIPRIRARPGGKGPYHIYGIWLAPDPRTSQGPSFRAPDWTHLGTIWPMDTPDGPILDPFGTPFGPLLDPYLELFPIPAIPRYPGLGLSGVAMPHTIYMAFGQLRIWGPARDPPEGPQNGPHLDPFAPSIPQNDPFWTHFGPHFGPLLGGHLGHLEIGSNTVKYPTSRMTRNSPCQRYGSRWAPNSRLWAIGALSRI
jgi:hypothetical protein